MIFFQQIKPQLMLEKVLDGTYVEYRFLKKHGYAGISLVATEYKQQNLRKIMQVQ